MFTALATAYGGLGAGREKKRAFEQEQTEAAQRHQEVIDAQASDEAYRKQTLQQQQDTLAQQQLRDAAAFRLQGLDKTGAPLAPLPVPGMAVGGTQVTGPERPSPSLNAAGQPIGPPAPGKTTTAPAWTSEQYLQAADYYDQNNRPDLAAGARASAATASTNALRQSTEAFNNSKIPVQQSIAAMNKAHADYFKALPGIDMAKVNSAATVAHIRANAQASAAATAAAGALQRTGLSNDTRLQAANLAGYYALTGKTQAEAVQLAISAANGAEKYAQAQGAATKDFSGYDPQASNGLSMLPAILAAISGNKGGGNNVTLQMPVIGKDGKVTFPGAAGGAPQDNAQPQALPDDKYNAAMAYDVDQVKKNPSKRAAVDAEIDRVPMSDDQRARAHAAIAAAAGAPAAAATSVAKPLPVVKVKNKAVTIPPPPAAGTPAANRAALAGDVSHAFSALNKQTPANVDAAARAAGLTPGTPAYQNFVHSHLATP